MTLGAAEMRLGSRAKITVGVGLIAATTFVVLGIREMRRDAAGAASARTVTLAAGRPESGQAVLAVATRPIATGETIRADMFRNALARPDRHPTAATPVEVLGKVATHDIPANAYVPRWALAQETKLAIRVPMGMRAISIDTTAEIAVAGLVRPGDRVDVQVVYPGEDAISGARGQGRSRARTLLQLVPVLAVGETVVGTQQPEGVEGAVSAPPPPARTVTLALTPDQVSELSLAKSTGALYLSLRNPEDKAELALAPSLSAPALPALAQPRRTAPPPIAERRPAPPLPRESRPARQEPHAIELVVGGESRTIYSGSRTR